VVTGNPLQIDYYAEGVWSASELVCAGPPPQNQSVVTRNSTRTCSRFRFFCHTASSLGKYSRSVRQFFIVREHALKFMDTIPVFWLYTFPVALHLLLTRVFFTQTNHITLLREKWSVFLNPSSGRSLRRGSILNVFLCPNWSQKLFLYHPSLRARVVAQHIWDRDLFVNVDSALAIFSGRAPIQVRPGFELIDAGVVTPHRSSTTIVRAPSSFPKSPYIVAKFEASMQKCSSTTVISHTTQAWSSHTTRGSSDLTG